MSSRSEQDSTFDRANTAQSKSNEPKGEQRGTRADATAQTKLPTQAQQAHPPTTTVMIYMAGDNNLSEECVFALTELKKAKPELVRIYVEFDPSDEFLPTQRYEINRRGPHTWNRPIAEDLIDHYPFKHKHPKYLEIKPPYGERRERRGEGSTGDPKMLYNFVAFCVEEPHKCHTDKPNPHKTDHYVLIICGHGGGIQRDYLLRDNRPNGNLTIYELRSALSWMSQYLKGKGEKDFKIDIFGMDVCLMSMAEITYELRDLVNIAIGNESYSPAAGWPYLETIRQIDTYAREAKTSSLSGRWEEISKGIVKAYVRFYSDYWLGGLSVSMSALKISKVHELTGLVRDLANEMIDELRREWDERQPEQHPIKDYDHDNADKENDYSNSNREVRDERKESEDCPPNTGKPKYEEPWKKRYPPLSFSDALTLAHWRAQSYNGELYVDLADFCNCLAEYKPRDSHIGRLCRKLSHFIKKEFTIISCSFGRSYQYSYGVSIYFPWHTLVPYYGASIRFPDESKWLLFIKTYLDVTRRAPRPFRIKIDKDVKEKVNRINFSDVRMGPDKMGPDKFGLDEGGNPIHSMRNPPIVFIPPECCTDEDVRTLNFETQYELMQSADLKEFLPHPKIKAIEKSNPGWILQATEAPIVPLEVETEDDDEV